MEKFLPKLYAYELKSLKEEMLAILKYRELLARGAVLPPRKEEVVERRSLPDGRVEVIKRVIIEPPQVKVPHVVAVAEEFKERKLPSGYWLYMKTDGMSRYDVAYYYCLGLKALFEPEILFEENIIVFGVYGTEEDAYADMDRLVSSGIPSELLSVGLRKD